MNGRDGDSVWAKLGGGTVVLCTGTSFNAAFIWSSELCMVTEMEVKKTTIREKESVKYGKSASTPS